MKSKMVNNFFNDHFILIVDFGFETYLENNRFLDWQQYEPEGL